MRTWFTISAVLVLALIAAVALKLSVPSGPPTIVARVGDIRLNGALQESCWTDGPGKKQCTTPETRPGEAVTIPGKGTLRIVVAYPSQPSKGTIVVSQGSKVVFSNKWRQNTRYELRPGRYELVANAEYPRGVHIEYAFAFRAK